MTHLELHATTTDSTINRLTYPSQEATGHWHPVIRTTELFNQDRPPYWNQLNGRLDSHPETWVDEKLDILALGAGLALHIFDYCDHAPPYYKRIILYRGDFYTLATKRLFGFTNQTHGRGFRYPPKRTLVLKPIDFPITKLLARPAIKPIAPLPARCRSDIIMSLIRATLADKWTCPILADALEEAGFTDTAVLAALRLRPTRLYALAQAYYFGWEL